MKSKTSYFPQYIYFSILLSVHQRWLKNIATPNDFEGSKTGFNRRVWENGKALQEGELTRWDMNSDFNGSLSFHVSPVIQLPWNCTAWLKLFSLAFDADMCFSLFQLSELTITKLPGDYFNCNSNDRSLY